MTRTNAAEFSPASPCIAIHVAERGARTLPRSLRCEIGHNVRFSTEALESYFFARWEPVAYDALLVAAAVEFADVTQRRSAYKWGREFELRIPVHDPDRWNDPRLSTPLHDVLSFLTGDRWTIRFHGRKKPETSPQQSIL